MSCAGVWSVTFSHALDFLVCVNALVTVKINQNQFDALISFSYNLGLGSLQQSTLLRLLNAGNFQAAADQFPRWDRAGGKEGAGLLARRNAERALFLTPD